MTEIEETELPGVGVRAEFGCTGGRRVGVIVHHSGRRELLVYGGDDPDVPLVDVALSDTDARTLAELLGGPRIAERLGAMAQRIEGLAIDWIHVADTAALVGQTLAESQVHTTTGVSVVAILREGETVAAPGATDVVRPGDTVVAVGTPEGMERFLELTRAR